MLKKLFLAIINSDGQSAKLLQMINKCAHPESRILDVGCGYGRNLDLLLTAGYANTIGVEINAEIVKNNKERDIPCLTVDEFNQFGGEYDIILMSHVIEHFAPTELKMFMDEYLDHLVPGGYLVIATPLLSDGFYDDFDHVKPYQPMGIQLVFGENKAQVQYYSRNKLILKDLWFRKSPYCISFSRSNYFKTSATYLLHLVNFISAIAFFISIKIIGKKDGWIGIFQKATLTLDKNRVN